VAVCVRGKAKYLSREIEKIMASMKIPFFTEESQDEKMERGPYKLSDFGRRSMNEKT
jgi:hypothetical protein